MNFTQQLSTNSPSKIKLGKVGEPKYKKHEDAEMWHFADIGSSSDVNFRGLRINYPHQKDLEGIEVPYINPLVFNHSIVDIYVRRILVNEGSSAKNLHGKAFKNVKLISKMDLWK